jgi:hypothetical protein
MPQSQRLMEDEHSYLQHVAVLFDLERILQEASMQNKCQEYKQIQIGSTFTASTPPKDGATN